MFYILLFSMNFIDQYQEPFYPGIHEDLPHPQSFRKLFETIKQRLAFLSLTFIQPFSHNNESCNYSSSHQIIHFCLLVDSKQSNYSYTFEILVNFVYNKFQIIGTITKHGIPIKVCKQGITQTLCSYSLLMNSLTTIYSLRINPITGYVKLVHTNHYQKKMMREILVFPGSFCELVKSHIEEMTNRLNERILGKILLMTNEISWQQILPQNTNFNLLEDCKQQEVKVKSKHILFPDQTVQGIYQIVRNLRTTSKYMYNSSSKYSFMNKDSQEIKIKFLQDLYVRKRDQEKQNRMSRTGIRSKILNFSKDVKNILKLYTPISVVNSQQITKQTRDSQNLWFEPTIQEIREISQILHVDNYIGCGKILTPIQIHQIENENNLARGGFAEIYAVYTTFSRKVETQNQEIRNENIIPPLKTKQYLVKKCAGREKLSWEKSIINHIGKGSCIFINKYYQVRSIQKNSAEDCIFMQYCQQRSMSTYLSRMGSFASVKLKLFFLFQVSIGLRFLRDYGVYHLDIKPQNLLIKMGYSRLSTPIPIVKIIDFGEAFFENAVGKKVNRGHTCPYASRELFSNGQKFNQKSDVFSLGVMILMMIFQLNTVDIKRLTCAKLFETNDGYTKFYSICAQKSKYFGFKPNLQCLLNLAYKCIHPLPTARPYLNWICVILRKLIDIADLLEK